MLFDTSAWIEFLTGSEKGKRIEEILNKEENFTSITTLAEITFWCLKNNLENKIESYLSGINKGSKILDLNQNLVTLAGRLNYERKGTNKNWGMMDSFVLATSFLYGLKILTKDSDFKDLPNAEIL